MAEHVGHSHLESGLIVHVLAVVLTERLLIEVTKQMERFDAHISTVDTTLQQRPEVLKAVGVNASIDILDSVIHNRVSVLSGQSLVGEQRIGIESRASLNMLLYFRLESGFLRFATTIVLTSPPRSKIPITAIISLVPVPVMRKRLIFPSGRIGNFVW
jgi:hypothetical protein